MKVAIGHSESLPENLHYSIFVERVTSPLKSKINRYICLQSSFVYFKA